MSSEPPPGSAAAAAAAAEIDRRVRGRRELVDVLALLVVRRHRRLAREAAPSPDAPTRDPDPPCRPGHPKSD